MKKYLGIFATLLVIVGVLYAADTQKVLRTAATLTTSYVASNPLDIQDNVATIEVYNTATNGDSTHTISLKPQWSVDTNNVNGWLDEPVSSAGTTNTTEQPYTRFSKRFDFSAGNTNLIFAESFNRWGAFRFFRVAIKDATGTGTNATIQILGSTAR